MDNSLLSVKRAPSNSTSKTIEGDCSTLRDDSNYIGCISRCIRNNPGVANLSSGALEMIEEGAILDFHHPQFETITQFEVAPSISHCLPSSDIFDPMALNATTTSRQSVAQVNFPHAREIGPTTIAKWMKAMDTGHSDNKPNKISGPILGYLCAAASPPITKAKQTAYIAEHGENQNEPVLDFAYKRGRGRSVREMKRRRNKKRNAARKKRVQREARGEDGVGDEVEDDGDESEFAGFSNNHGHIDGCEEGGPLSTKYKRTSLLNTSEQTVVTPAAEGGGDNGGG